MAERIGILGGTFNPVHTGHLLIAEGVKNKLRLDCVLFIPCCFPPHKMPSDFASAEHRLKMTKLAVSGNPSFKVSPAEINRGGRTYSVDTLEYLRKRYGEKADFYFIVGSDSLPDLHKWKKMPRLMELCVFISAVRPGYDTKCKGVKMVNVPVLPVSSTDIRKAVKKGTSIRYLVPEKVRMYIKRHKLYL